MPDVLGILERVEDEHERRLAALDAPGEDLVERGEPARPDDERDALVAVEAGEGGQRAALHLDDRDPQARGVEDELLERLPALRDDEQADRGSPGDERLLDRAAAGDQLLVLGEEAGGRRRRAAIAVRASPGCRAGPTHGGADRIRVRVAGRRTAGVDPANGGRGPGERRPRGRRPGGPIGRGRPGRSKAVGPRRTAVGRTAVGRPVGRTAARGAIARRSSRAVDGRRSSSRSPGTGAGPGRVVGPCGRPVAIAARPAAGPMGARSGSPRPGRSAGWTIAGLRPAATARRRRRAHRRDGRPDRAGPPDAAPGSGPAVAIGIRAASPSERMPNPRLGGRVVDRGGPAGGRRPASRLRGPDRWLPAGGGPDFFGSRSRGFLGFDAAPWPSGSVTSGLHEPAPALAVARVLDGDAPRDQLVAEAIRRRPVASRARRDALVEQRRELRLEVIGLVREDAEDRVDAAQPVGRPRRVGRRQRRERRSAG